MGNQLVLDHGVDQHLDFNALFVDGENWSDAQNNDCFLSKVQRCLLDPSFVSALQLDTGDEQVSIRWPTKRGPGRP